MGFSDLAVQEMKREPKRATPSRSLAPFFVRSLTLAPRSLLRNSTETLATQASLAQALKPTVKSWLFFKYVFVPREALTSRHC